MIFFFWCLFSYYLLPVAGWYFHILVTKPSIMDYKQSQHGGSSSFNHYAAKFHNAFKFFLCWKSTTATALKIQTAFVFSLCCFHKSGIWIYHYCVHEKQLLKPLNLGDGVSHLFCKIWNDCNIMWNAPTVEHLSHYLWLCNHKITKSFCKPVKPLPRRSRNLGCDVPNQNGVMQGQICG